MSGARLKPAAAILGLTDRTIQRWRHQECREDRRRGPLTAPANKLTMEERQEVMTVANSLKYRELSPKQIVPRLADEGRYVASESTFYRILREKKQLAHRERCRPATHRRPREKVATGPCQVWSWDITYLRSNVAGRFFYLYLIMDVWSRKIIAATVFSKECGQNSALMLVEAYHRHGVAGSVLR
jgi:putative transposase